MADPVIELGVAEGARVRVLATVQGLVSEADAVRAEWSRAKPAAVALGVSQEAVVGLRKALTEGPQPIGVAGWSEEEGEEYDAEDALGDSEIAYGLALERYGKVRLPPPDLLAAVRLADDAGVPVFGVDFSQEQYERAFLSNVRFLSVLRYDRIAKRLAKAPPSPESAREFAVEWDRRLLKVKGYAALEAAREERLAAGVRRVAQVHPRVLLMVDVARRDGVVTRLESPAPAPATGPSR